MNPYIYKPPPPPPFAVKKKPSSSKTPETSSNNSSNNKPSTSHLKANPPQLRKRPEPYTLKSPPPQKPKQPLRDVVVVEPKSNLKISLNTEQEIQAWIAERKRRWPTEARIQAKKELEEKQKKDQQAKYDSNNSIQNKNPNANGNNTKQQQRTPGICRHFLAGRCHNANCRFLHPRPDQVQQKQDQKVTASKIYKLYEAPKKMPLFKMLVQNDLDDENKKVMDFIEYLCTNNVI
jgi:ribosome assembly protein 1